MNRMAGGVVVVVSSDEVGLFECSTKNMTTKHNNNPPSAIIGLAIVFCEKLKNFSSL